MGSGRFLHSLPIEMSDPTVTEPARTKRVDRRARNVDHT